jgi:1-acyl-sn-glycerol-3-phosphate acyltransferase
MLISLFVFVVIVTLSIPSAIIFIPLAVITGRIGWLNRVGCTIARIGLFAAGVRIRVEGRGRIPQNTACIFLSNHVSNLDPPVLLPLVPGRTSVFLKKSLMKIPVLGYCFKLGSFIPVGRAGSPEQAQQSIAIAAKVLASGLHVTSFVEGTRSRDGRMLPFKKGPFYLAQQSGAPIIPVSICGTETLMAKGRFGIKPGTVHLTFHEPIDPKQFANRAELITAVRQAIASGLPEWMRN